ncbi:MAG: hypothetical protein FWD66_05195 [Paludibacter sp.]|nr:hypothetical protein [Paludibacter sp.]
MTASEIHKVFRQACNLLTRNNLFLSFERVKLLIDELKSKEMLERYNDLRQDYGFLLDYFVDGTEDDERKNSYIKIQKQVFLLVSDLREMLLADSNNYEYVEKRRMPSREFKSATEILYFIEKLTQQIEFQQNSLTPNKIEIVNIQARKEKLASQLFATFWLKNELTEEEKIVFEKIVSTQYDGIAEKTLVVSALILSLWRIFNEEKLLLLLDCCQNEDLLIRQRALVGLVFVLSKYNQFLQFFKNICMRLMMLVDNEHITNALENIILQIISTKQTEDINKKMREEILPEISKLIPKIRNFSDIENFINSEEEWDEENPQWQNYLDQSATDKLQEIAELQLQGADIYMSTFANFKNYPFFSEISNWFRPFEYNQVDVMRIMDTAKPDKKSLVSAIINSSIMCNSDKFSFLLSMEHMPDKQKKMFFEAINAEIGQFEEIEKDEKLLNPEKQASNISKQYIQDLYRFFKLFTWHIDFADMFSATLFIHKTLLFTLLKENNADIEQNTANYFFSKNLYPQAIEMFENITKKNSADFAAFQKLGFAYQKTGSTQKALDNYLRADLIQTDDIWTLKKIAICYRVLLDYNNALTTYQHIDFLNPNIKNKFNIARCHIELENYSQARCIYSELEKTDDTAKLWQAITWCAFANGNIAEAEYYSKRCTENNPNLSDFYYAAHIALCNKNYADAIDYYLKSIDNKKEEVESLITSIENDQKYLINNGIYIEEFTYLYDAIRTKI